MANEINKRNILRRSFAYKMCLTSDWVSLCVRLNLRLYAFLLYTHFYVFKFCLGSKTRMQVFVQMKMQKKNSKKQNTGIIKPCGLWMRSRLYRLDLCIKINAQHLTAALPNATNKLYNSMCGCSCVCTVQCTAPSDGGLSSSNTFSSISLYCVPSCAIQKCATNASLYNIRNSIYTNHARARADVCAFRM